MGFGINKKYGLHLLNPYSFYKEVKRKKLLKIYAHKQLTLGLGVSISNTIIGNYVHLGNNVTISNSEINDHSYVNSNSIIFRTKIGKFCSIGPNVRFGLGVHPTDLISTHPAFYSNNKAFKTFADRTYYKEYGNIVLENDIWIGANVIILDNVTIGNGAIVAAGAIVTKNVLPFEVVGGVPAKHIKFRLEKEIRDKVMQSDWWNKDENWFVNNFEIFLDKTKFLEYICNRKEKKS